MTHIHKLNHHIYKNRFFYLLIGIIVFMLIPAMFYHSAHLKIIRMAVLTFFLLMVFNFIRSFRKTLVHFGLLIFISYVLDWLYYLIDDQAYIAYANYSTSMVIFLMILLQLLSQINKSDTVDLNIVWGSVSGYLLIGMFFASMVALFDQLYAGAFIANIPMKGADDYLYFTLVTMTTLGYGDISPAIPPTKTLSVTIAFTGQIYTTVIIAIIVSKYITQDKRS